MFWALKKLGKKPSTGVRNIEFCISYWRVVGVKPAFLLKTVKRMLYLGHVLLRYVLIYNLEVSFNFHLTFLQLNVIKMFTVQ